MKCPRCVQQIHRSAAQCPHCGFAMCDLDGQYGGGEVRMRRLSDAAGVLRLKERKTVQGWFERFETNFPQLFFSVYLGALDERSNIRQFGMWVLNRGAFEDVDLTRPNEGGVLLVIDVNSKTAFLANGYLLDIYLKEEDTFRVLSKAHPHLLQGNYCKALKVILAKLTSTVKRCSRHAKKDLGKYQNRAGRPSQAMSDILQQIREPNDTPVSDLANRSMELTPQVTASER